MYHFLPFLLSFTPFLHLFSIHPFFHPSIHPSFLPSHTLPSHPLPFFLHPPIYPPSILPPTRPSFLTSTPPPPLAWTHHLSLTFPLPCPTRGLPSSPGGHPVTLKSAGETKSHYLLALDGCLSSSWEDKED